MSVLSQRKALEDRMLSRLGFIIRVFQEDNNTKASWGYTVGLKVNEQPVCLFLHIPVESSLLDSILTNAAAMVQFTGIPSLPFSMDDYEAKDGQRLRFKFRRMTDELPGELRDFNDTHIEGQDPDTKYYWLFAADAENILPGEEGYTDFKQLTFPGNPSDNVSDDVLLNELNIET